MPTSIKGFALGECRAYVVHAFYGCESGCCGHEAILVSPKDDLLEREFIFTHPVFPTESAEEWIRTLVDDFWPGVSIDLPRCEVIDD
jgi:hypothetical protein